MKTEKKKCSKRPTRAQLEAQLHEANGKVAALEGALKRMTDLVVDLATRPVTVPVAPTIPLVPRIPMPGETWPPYIWPQTVPNTARPPWLPWDQWVITCQTDHTPKVDEWASPKSVAPLTVDGGVERLTVGDKEGIALAGNPGVNPNICTATTIAPFDNAAAGVVFDHLTLKADPKLVAGMSAASAPSIPPEFVAGHAFTTWTSGNKYGSSAASGCGNPGFGSYSSFSSSTPPPGGH